MKRKFDLIVAGAGIAGICASIAAAREGYEVLLIERESKPGGVITNSLVMPMMTFHSKKRQVIGGIAQEIVDTLVAKTASPGHVEDPIGFVRTLTPIVPDKCVSIFNGILANEKVHTAFDTEIESLKVESGSVRSVSCNCHGNTAEYEARIFIDATGDGNFSIAAGNTFKEGNGNRNCVQPMSLIFNVGGIDRKGIINNILENRENFVLAESKHIEEMLRKYLAVSGFFKEALKMKDYGIAFKRDRLLFFQVPFSEDEISFNTNRYVGFGNDKAVVLKNREIAVEDTLKFMKYLKNEVPGFGNAYLVKFAEKMGIRETTHVDGVYTYKIDDLISSKHFGDCISVGAYPVDYHSPHSPGLESRQLEYPGEYFLPYSCMLPNGLANVLLAGRAVSCDHMAFSAIRTSPLSASTGQVAGIAASMALNGKTLPHLVDVGRLRKKLADNGVIVE